MDFSKFLDSLEPFEMEQLKAAFLRRNGGAANFLDSVEIKFARAGQKIEAIKSLRYRMNLSLLEAKTLVEAYMAANP